MARIPVFMGIDLGTTGIRIMVCDENGKVIKSSKRGVEDSFISSENQKVSEQNPIMWEPALQDTFQDVLASAGIYDLKAVCCDSTSGTIIPVDRDFRPVYNAILHNDTRANEESKYINGHTSISVKPSFSLSKILWIKRNREDVYEKTYKFIHAADYIKGLISGEFDTTDFSNAVKTGYDLINEKWPDEIERTLCISKDKLPGVVKTSDICGELKADIQKEAGIKDRVKVVAGATDSTTGFYSSGARILGDWNTTLGTVLGIKGISGKYIILGKI